MGPDRWYRSDISTQLILMSLLTLGVRTFEGTSGEGRVRANTKRVWGSGCGGRLADWAVRPPPSPTGPNAGGGADPPRVCIRQLCRRRSLLVGKPQEEEFKEEYRPLPFSALEAVPCLPSEGA